MFASCLALTIVSILSDVLHEFLTHLLLTLEDMLTDEFAADPRVRLGHMACALDGGSVVFLYRLEDGVCPRSYGINVARMAGLPKQVCLLKNTIVACLM